MNYVVNANAKSLTQEQRQLAGRLKISDGFLALLLSRGFCDEHSIAKFLHPSINDFSSPFDIDGMKAAADRLKKAIRDRERVLIYGDYDCDGICAIAILMLYLKDKVDASYFIPDRNKDGYGISVDALKGIIARKRPGLVITVDCGITAIQEVEYLKSQGIDTIVTDHHEPQAQIPDCIVVDPKVQKTGYFDFCGAGVALKLVEAMAGRDEATKYLDICAIATIADVVPLTKDNRIIAYHGLKQISSNPRKGIKMMLGEDKATSQNIMFRLAPRMNAAGRLNSAMKVVSLFLENDYFMLKTLAEELSRDNARRQELCETAVAEAKEMLRGVDFNETNIIVLKGEDWEAGILGIAAARLVDEFKRPTVLFARSGDELKGSARSVPSVNIFELFSSLSAYFTAFGGHAQAAGVSMTDESFEAFKTAANEALSNCPSSDFCPNTECDMALDLNGDVLSFAKELELLEPTGYGNPKPNFLVNVKNFKFDKIGFSNHMKCSTKAMDLMAFSKYSHVLAPRISNADFEISLGLNTFQNNTVAQGIVQSLKINSMTATDDECKTYNLHHLDFEGSVNLENVDIKFVENLLEKPFGTLVVCFDWSAYETLAKSSQKIKNLPFVFADSPHLNPENQVVVAPSSTFDFGFYQQVILVGHPLTEGYEAYIAKRVKTYALGDTSARTLKLPQNVLRTAYRHVYDISVAKTRMQSMAKFYAYVSSRMNIGETEFFAAIKVFEQLGLLKIGDRGMIEVSRRSVELTNSVAYRNLSTQ
ncbi:MAG: single-stranded-DNA-specific exonuclease RecJ [Clostridia bacterium]|nr:single-stranded-DNA-specific exonuclease RecJ [Clostridia bacterium]